MSDRITVKSSNIAAFGFTPTDGPLGDLTVHFTNGRSYVYRDVPFTVNDELLAECMSPAKDASVGKLFNKLVRSGGYEYEEVEDDAG